MKREKKITETYEWSDGDSPPEDAKGFVAWFQDKIDAVPEESRDSLRIELGTTESFSDATIEFTYTRLETDEEAAAREREEAALAERCRERELRTLAELQAKYGKQ